MIIAHFNVIGVVVISPDKADAVLIVDPYAVLSFPVTFEHFETISGRKSEIVQDLGSIHHFELPTRGAFELPKTIHRDAVKEVLGFFVSEALNHAYSV
jgi:hypothetical protein